MCSKIKVCYLSSLVFNSWPCCKSPALNVVLHFHDKDSNVDAPDEYNKLIVIKKKQKTIPKNQANLNDIKCKFK